MVAQLPHTVPMRKLTTPLRALAALAVATFTLTGCMKVDMNLTINADDTVSGTAILALDKRLAGLVGKSEDELVSELTKDTGNIPKGAKQEKYAEGDFVGAKYTFEKAKLSEFSDNDLKIVHKDGKYTFDAKMDLADVKLDDPAAKSFADSFVFKISITFPGEVLEHNGKLDGKTVTWNPKAGQSTDLHAVSEEGSSIPWTLIIVGVGVLLLLIVAVVVVLLVVLSKKKAAAVPAAEADGTGPAALPTTHDTVVEELPTADGQEPKA